MEMIKNMKNIEIKKVKTKAQIESDPRVECLDYEGTDGWWCYLKKGYRESLNDSNLIHYETIQDIAYTLNWGVYSED